MIRKRLVEMFLYPIRYKGRGRGGVIYNTCKEFLMNDYLTLQELAKITDAKDEGTVRSRIIYACERLNLKNSSVHSLRTAYIKFLEEEIETLSDDN